jgi:hypothetical membrane protein
MDEDSSMDSRLLSYIGVIAPIGFVIAVVILGALTPGYSPIYHTISELGEVGAPYSREASFVFIVTGLLIAIFGYGLHRNLPKRDYRVLSGLCVMVYALLDFVGSGVFPVDPGGAANTVTASYHVTLTVLGELAALAMPATFLMDTDGLNGWDELRRFSKIIFALSIPAAAFLVYTIEGNVPGVMDTPIGLAQRVLVGLYLTWIAGAAFETSRVRIPFL